MPSALPAKSSNSIRFGSLSSVGLPSLSYSYLVAEAVPTTCSGGIPYIFSDPMRAEVLAAAGDDVGPIIVCAQEVQHFKHRLIDQFVIRSVPARMPRGFQPFR